MSGRSARIVFGAASLVAGLAAADAVASSPAPAGGDAPAATRAAGPGLATLARFAAGPADPSFAGIARVAPEPADPSRAPFAGIALEPADPSLAPFAGIAARAPEPARARRERAARSEPAPFVPVFTAERARILLRSLTVPGWGQATAGHRTSATVFALAETGIWTTFTAFRVQSELRRDAYQRTARILAGIDLRDRDEEFRRIVGSYLSSDEYNLYVVRRDAANLFLSDPENPDYEGYRAYIAAHELRGDNLWSWRTVDDLLRYRAQRKDAQRASIRANSLLAAAVVNRLLSAVHAARAAGGGAAAPRSWNLEVAPTDPDDATAYRLGVRARF